MSAAADKNIALDPHPTVFTASLPLTVPLEHLKEIFEDAWPGVHYWADGLSWDDTGIVVDEHNDDGSFTTRKVGWQKVVDAFAIMASGQYRDHNDSLQPLNPYISRAAMMLFTDYDDIDYDATVMDTVVQMAALGKVIYG